MNIYKKFEFLYPILAVLSILLITWQHIGMNKTYQIFPSLKTTISSLNDNINGGVSNGTIKQTTKYIQLHCETHKSSYTFAFCGLLIPLKKDNQGIDLIRYQSLTISLSFQSNTKDTILVYLLNSEKDKSKQSIKRANLRAIYPYNGTKNYTFNLSSFSVPSWWLFAHADHVSSPEPNLSNVTDLQISTGDNAFDKTETIKVTNIQLNGKLLSTQHLYIILITLWCTAIILHIFWVLGRFSNQLKKYRIKEAELQAINDFLAIEKNKFESMAKIDPLTQIYNRSGVRDILDNCIVNYKKHNIPAALIMFDIDKFKNINDQYGHDTGDEVLKNIVKLIQQHIRKNDCFARWGGEEFILICPNTSIDMAIKLAEKHRLCITNNEIIMPKITCSFGVSELSSTDITNWFKKADVCLYQAKAQGRNQVCY